MTLIESLASPEYILLWFTFLGNEITGLLIISKIQSIVTNQLGKDSTTAATINSLIGVCNLCGRLFVPALSDLVGRKVCFLISFLVQSILLGILPTFLNNSKYEAVLTCFFGIAFFYGGGFGVIPAFLADLFGGKNVGATHGCILLAWSLGAVVGGTVFNHLLSVESVRLGPAGIVRIYDLNFRWILVIVLLCAFLCSWVPVEVEERFGEKRKGVWFTKSVPFFGIVPIGIPKK